MSERNGIEIAKGTDGGVVIRDHATGTLFHGVTKVELLLDAETYNGNNAYPVLRVHCINLVTAQQEYTSYVPAGVQTVVFSTPVFVEVHQKETGHQREWEKRQEKRRRKVRRARAVVREDDKRFQHIRPVVELSIREDKRDSDGAELYAAIHGQLLKLADRKPALREFVAGLPSPGAAENVNG